MDADATSDLLANGLAAAAQTLAETDPMTDEARFLHGGVLFLRAAERAFQTRYRVGVTDNFATFPLLRQTLPENPDPDPFEGAVIESLFTDLLSDLDASRKALGGIAGTADFGVEIPIDALWFDINDNGARDDGEGVLAIAGAQMGMGPGAGTAEPPTDALTVRFDTADARWLEAYTHVLSAFGELTLSFSPAEDIDRVLGWSARRAELRGAVEGIPPGLLGPNTDTYFDGIAILTHVIETQPDPVRTRAVRRHLIAMIDANLGFWSRVADETDNDREWIPNDRQQSALPVPFPEGLGDGWQAVLADARKVLEGELLVPHHAFGPEAGINLKRLLDDPPPVDIIDWIHGGGLLDVIEEGPLIDSDSWRRFEALVSGRSAIYMVILN